MPSEYSPADDHAVQPYPDIEAAIDENPARFLDRDLLAATPPGESSPKLLAEARIRGIDYVAVAEAYLHVELNLARDECPRSGIVGLLNERIQWLRDHGDRDARATYRAEPGTVDTTSADIEWTHTDDGDRSVPAEVRR
jgi:hypothetical protein